LLTNPTEAPKNAVVAPIKVITNKAVGLYSRIGDDLNSKYIPAVTRVAACNNAETGVGFLSLNKYNNIINIIYISEKNWTLYLKKIS